MLAMRAMNFGTMDLDHHTGLAHKREVDELPLKLWGRPRAARARCDIHRAVAFGLSEVTSTPAWRRRWLSNFRRDYAWRQNADELDA